MSAESLSTVLPSGPDGYQPVAFAPLSGRGCCGGAAPNFFSSHPAGRQARLGCMGVSIGVFRVQGYKGFALLPWLWSRWIRRC